MNKRWSSFLSMALLLSGPPLLLPSCETKDQDCYQPINIKVRTAFVFQSRIDTSFVVILPDTTYTVDSSFTRNGDLYPFTSSFEALDVDTTFDLVGIKTSSFALPLNPSRDSMRYRYSVDTSSAIYDTLTLRYVPSLRFISNSCGYTYYYEIASISGTRNVTDSVVLNNKNVNNEGSVRHVLIYLKH